MLETLQSLVSRWRFGEPVTIVSGVPRSGTSMMMRMLDAGGMPVLTDHNRPPDEDNPHGYFELDKVKSLETDTDRTWVKQARGKAIKVISHLLESLPRDNRYHVVFLTRDIGDIIASQNSMLARLGEGNPIADSKAHALLERHVTAVKALAIRRQFKLLEVPFEAVVEQPGPWTLRISEFVGAKLDHDAMNAVVDRARPRQRNAYENMNP